MKASLVIFFSCILKTILKNAQAIGHMCFILKILKDKSLPFGRTRKAYILKSRHIELAIGDDIYSKFLEEYT